MINFILQFGEAKASGIGALGLNLKSFIFQLVTFLLVLLVLRKWVFPKLVATLEERREVLEQSLVQARQTEETLRRSESRAEDIIKQARTEADSALSDANNRAKEIIGEAEKAGEKSASRIVTEAEEHLSQERSKLKDELKEELAELVTQATEKVIKKRLTTKDDEDLIKDSIRELEA